MPDPVVEQATAQNVYVAPTSWNAYEMNRKLYDRPHTAAEAAALVPSVREGGVGPNSSPQYVYNAETGQGVLASQDQAILAQQQAASLASERQRVLAAEEQARKESSLRAFETARFAEQLRQQGVAGKDIVGASIAGNTLNIEYRAKSESFPLARTVTGFVSTATPETFREAPLFAIPATSAEAGEATQRQALASGNVTLQPKGTEKLFEIRGVDIPSTLEATKIGTVGEAGAYQVGKGFSEIAKAGEWLGELKTNEPLTTLRNAPLAAGLFAAGAFKVVAGSEKRAVQGVKDDPGEFASQVVLYSAAELVLGPAGPGALFAMQNVAEGVGGRKPSVVQIIESPLEAVGGSLPFLAALGTLNLGTKFVVAKSEPFFAKLAEQRLAKSVSETRGEQLALEQGGRVSKVTDATVQIAGREYKVTTVSPESGYALTPVEGEIRSVSFLRDSPVLKGQSLARSFSEALGEKGDLPGLFSEQKYVSTVSRGDTVLGRAEGVASVGSVSANGVEFVGVVTPETILVTGGRDVPVPAKASYGVIVEQVRSETPNRVVSGSTGTMIERGGSNVVGQLQIASESQKVNYIYPEQVLMSHRGGGFEFSSKGTYHYSPGELVVDVEGGAPVQAIKSRFVTQQNAREFLFRSDERPNSLKANVAELKASANLKSELKSVGVETKGVAESVSVARETILATKESAVTGLKTGALTADVSPLSPELVAREVIAPDVVTQITPKGTAAIGGSRLSSSESKESVEGISFGDQAFEGDQIVVGEASKILVGSSTFTPFASRMARSSGLMSDVMIEGLTTETATKLSSASKLASVTMLDVGQVTRQEVAQSQATRLQTTRLQGTQTRGLFTSNVPKTPSVSLGTTTTPSSNSASRRRLFNVLVRRRGKFSQVNAAPLELERAVSRGRGLVEGSLAASFKLSPIDGGRVDFSLPGSIYRASKREAGVFVQKVGKRLSSIGERQEIKMTKVR